MIGEHCRVRLLVQVDDQGRTFPSGTIGVVVHIYKRGEAFEVEFADERPAVVVTLTSRQVKVVR